MAQGQRPGPALPCPHTVQARPWEGAGSPGRVQTLPHASVPHVPWLTPSQAKSSPTPRNLAGPGLPAAPLPCCPQGPGHQGAHPMEGPCRTAGGPGDRGTPLGPLLKPGCSSVAPLQWEAHLSPSLLGRPYPTPAPCRQTDGPATFVQIIPQEPPLAPPELHPWALPSMSYQPWEERGRGPEVGGEAARPSPCPPPLTLFRDPPTPSTCHSRQAALSRPFHQHVLCRRPHPHRVPTRPGPPPPGAPHPPAARPLSGRPWGQRGEEWADGDRRAADGFRPPHAPCCRQGAPHIHPAHSGGGAQEVASSPPCPL